MRLPSSLTGHASTAPNGLRGHSHPQHAQRLRVREMLRGVRQHQLNQLSEPLSTDVASVLQTGATAASASAFGDSRAFTASGVGGGAQVGGGGVTSHEPVTASSVAVFVVSVIAFTVVFVVVGQWVDGLLGTVAPSDADIDTAADTTADTEPFGTTVAKTVGQMLINVALLIVPYFVLAHYAPHSLVYQYYPIIGAFWVVSLHAQQQLRNRFSRILEGNAAREEALMRAKKKRDAQLVAAHAAAAAVAQKKTSASNAHAAHLRSIHHTHSAPEPRNAMPQPATHPSPPTPPSMRAQESFHTGNGWAPVGGGGSGNEYAAMFDGSQSQAGLAYSQLQDGATTYFNPVIAQPPRDEPSPMAFSAQSDLLTQSPLLASSDLGGSPVGSFSRETSLTELLR